jgi:hypothetical protein
MMAAYVEGGDSAGRVAGDELHLDAELAEEVLARGVEASARTLVEDERRHLPAGTVVVCADVAVRGELVEPELRGGGPDEEAEDGDSERRRDQSQCRRRPRHICTLMVCRYSLVLDRLAWVGFLEMMSLIRHQWSVASVRLISCSRARDL